jgi:response regulator RpfG family c-di-GMP phosphodiesterase
MEKASQLLIIAIDDEPVILEFLHDSLADMNLRIISARIRN